MLVRVYGIGIVLPVLIKTKLQYSPGIKLASPRLSRSVSMNLNCVGICGTGQLYPKRRRAVAVVILMLGSKCLIQEQRIKQRLDL
jgi:hypothetical protein